MAWSEVLGSRQGEEEDIPAQQRMRSLSRVRKTFMWGDDLQYRESGQAQRLIPVIPAIREAEAGGSPDVGSSRPA